VSKEQVAGADGCEPRPLDALSGRRPRRMWGGRGSGAPCSACGKPVAPDEVEFELEYDDAGLAPEPYRVHGRCFAAWESLRGAAGDAGSAGVGMPGPRQGLTGSLHDGDNPGRGGGPGFPAGSA